MSFFFFSSEGGRQEEEKTHAEEKQIATQTTTNRKQQSFEFVSEALLSLPKLDELAVRTMRPTSAMPGEAVVLFHEGEAGEEGGEGGGTSATEATPAPPTLPFALRSLDVRGMLGRDGLWLAPGRFRNLSRLDLRGQVSQWTTPLPRYPRGGSRGGGATTAAGAAATPTTALPPIAFLPSLSVLLFGFSEASPHCRFDLAELLAGVGSAAPQQLEEEEEEEEAEEAGEVVAAAAVKAEGGNVEGGGRGGEGGGTTTPGASGRAPRVARGPVFPPPHAYPNLRLVVLENCELEVGDAAAAEARALGGGSRSRSRRGARGGGGRTSAATSYFLSVVPALAPKFSRLHLHGCSFASSEDGGAEARELARGLASAFASAAAAKAAARPSPSQRRHSCKETCFGCQAWQGESEGEWAPEEMRW